MNKKLIFKMNRKITKKINLDIPRLVVMPDLSLFTVDLDLKDRKMYGKKTRCVSLKLKLKNL